VIPTPEERPTVSVEEAGALCGLGRSAAYDAVRRGELPALRFGRSLRVPTARLRVLLGLDREPEADSSTASVVPIYRKASR
jgi:excisionase family DNA binding protein